MLMSGHMSMYFNPRSREGSDHIRLIMVIRILVFQSTLPRRERLNVSADYLLDLDISIHAPAKGATRVGDVVSLTFKDFNPRSREGSDDIIFNS